MQRLEQMPGRPGEKSTSTTSVTQPRGTVGAAQQYIANLVERERVLAERLEELTPKRREARAGLADATEELRVAEMRLHDVGERIERWQDRIEFEQSIRAGAEERAKAAWPAMVAINEEMASLRASDQILRRSFNSTLDPVVQLIENIELTKQLRHERIGLKQLLGDAHVLVGAIRENKIEEQLDALKIERAILGDKVAGYSIETDSAEVRVGNVGVALARPGAAYTLLGRDANLDESIRVTKRAIAYLNLDLEDLRRSADIADGTWKEERRQKLIRGAELALGKREELLDELADAKREQRIARDLSASLRDQVRDLERARRGVDAQLLEQGLIDGVVVKRFIIDKESKTDAKPPEAITTPPKTTTQSLCNVLTQTTDTSYLDRVEGTTELVKSLNNGTYIEDERNGIGGLKFGTTVRDRSVVRAKEKFGVNIVIENGEISVVNLAKNVELLRQLMQHERAKILGVKGAEDLDPETSTPEKMKTKERKIWSDYMGTKVVQEQLDEWEANGIAPMHHISQMRMLATGKIPDMLHLQTRVYINTIAERTRLSKLSAPIPGYSGQDILDESGAVPEAAVVAQRSASRARVGEVVSGQGNGLIDSTDIYKSQEPESVIADA